MNGTFTIRADVTPEILRNQYTSGYQRVFGAIWVDLEGSTFPCDFWGDFGLALLLNWNRDIHRLAAGKCRAAKLFFTDWVGEIWVRKTAKPLWKVSCVEQRDRGHILTTEV